MDYSVARPEDMSALQRLPQLQKVILGKKMEAMECIKALVQLPHTTSIQINSSSNGSPFISQMFPFADNEIESALSFISDRRNTALEIYLYVTIGSSFWPHLHNARRWRAYLCTKSTQRVRIIISLCSL